jgi:alkylation response protein AidB-like acyl-CoA dehydrogenase
MEMTIARDRWQEHLKTRGRYYHDRAADLEAVASTVPESGADVAAQVLHALAEVMELARIHRLTRDQHVLFRLGALIAVCEGAEALARRAAAASRNELPPKTDDRFDAEALSAISRVFARDAALRVAGTGSHWILGATRGGAIDPDAFASAIRLEALHRAQAGLIADMDVVADALYERSPSSPSSKVPNE